MTTNSDRAPAPFDRSAPCAWFARPLPRNGCPAGHRTTRGRCLEHGARPDDAPGDASPITPRRRPGSTAPLSAWEPLRATAGDYEAAARVLGVTADRARRWAFDFALRGLDPRGQSAGALDGFTGICEATETATRGVCVPLTRPPPLNSCSAAPRGRCGDAFDLDAVPLPAVSAATSRGTARRRPAPLGAWEVLRAWRAGEVLSVKRALGTTFVPIRAWEFDFASRGLDPSTLRAGAVLGLVNRCEESVS